MEQPQSFVLLRLHQLYLAHPEAAWSWTRLNQALQMQLEALILVGAPFARDDFATLARDPHLRFAQWGGADGVQGFGERFYCAAVKAGNGAACASFEAWKGRKPFLWEGRRLYLGVQVRWQDEWTTLTSFAEDGTAVTLCSYEDDGAAACATCRRVIPTYARKVRHRYRVTLTALHAADATRHTRRPTPGGTA